MRQKVNGRTGILVGLMWSVLAWVIFFSTYTGILSQFGSAPLNAGFWLVENAIEPVSVTLAMYVNAFVCSVPIAVFIGWFVEVFSVKLISLTKRRVVFYRAKGQGRPKRKYTFLRRKGDAD